MTKDDDTLYKLKEWYDDKKASVEDLTDKQFYKLLDFLDFELKSQELENNIILDPFAGSGTTPYIAKKYSRNFIAIEKEEKYFKAIEKRVAIKHKKDNQIPLSKKYTINQEREQDCNMGLFSFNNQIKLNKERSLQA